MCSTSLNLDLRIRTDRRLIKVRLLHLDERNHMGIQNRDYMKRPSDDDDRRASTSEASAEEFFARFLRRHPRFFIYAGAGLAALIVVAIAVAMLTGRSH